MSAGSRLILAIIICGMASPAFVEESGLTVHVPPGSTDYLDAQEGFRGMAFGTDISTVKGLVLKEDHGNMKTYIRTKDDMTLGGVALTNVTYGFFKGRFFLVKCRTTKENGKALFDALTTEFGKAEGGSVYDVLVFFWYGKKVMAWYAPDTVAFVMAEKDLWTHYLADAREKKTSP